MLKEKYLAIIPARKGSKRLPNKNILELGGKPLIAWTIEAAINSKYLNKIVVSTDSEQITEISKTYGAEVPFLRPEELATDTATSFDVVKHVLDYYKGIGFEYEYIIVLQPTSPLRTTEDIDKAIELQISKNAEAIISVCEMEHSPLWSNILPEDNSMQNFLKSEVIGKRSQDLQTYYRINGAIYLIKVSSFLSGKTFFNDKDSYAYIMDKYHSIDIDDLNDFSYAEFILKKS